MLIGNGGGSYIPIVQSSGFDYAQNPYAAVDSGVPGFYQLANENPSWSFDKLIDAAKAGLQVWSGMETQKAFLEANKQRIASGLAPISWDQFGATTASVGVQLDSSTRNAIMVGGLALIAIVAFAMMRK